MDVLGVAAHARANPSKTAIVTEDRRIAYAELDARSNMVAHALAGRGVGAGDRVALALRNRPEAFEVLTGAARLGAEIVPVSWRCAPEEFEYYVADSGARVLLAEDEHRAATAGLPAIHLSDYEAWLAGSPATPPPDTPDPAPTLLRYYTSGTTGRPKAVERPPRRADEYLDSVVASCHRLAVGGPDQVHLMVGPAYHSGPLSYGVYSLLLGQTLVLPARSDPAQVLDLIERERVTWSFMVPIHFIRLLALPDEQRARDLSSVRRILHAGAPCPPEVKRAALALFPPGTIWEFYGSTEGRGTLISPEEWLRKPGSVGRPIEGIRIAILDEMGRELPPGEVGLIYMSPVGAERFVYAGAPDKTDAAWRGDLFTVGDMGYLDEDGYLFLTDRQIDMIITGGANVYPAEVEATLHRHPAVADVAVVGVPDEEFGESVLAIVELGSPADAGDLIAFCREHLAHYKCPRSVQIVEQLPRDPNGKVRKRDLRAPWWKGRARAI